MDNPEENPLEAGCERKSRLEDNPCFLPSPSKSPPPKRPPETADQAQDETRATPLESHTSANLRAPSSPEIRPQDTHQAGSTGSKPESTCKTVPPSSGFLRDAVVWVARPSDASRLSGRAPSNRIIPTGQQLNTLDSLLLACGWHSAESGAECEWVQKGVIFVDDEGEQTIDWRAYPLSTLLERRAALARTFESRTRPPKPVWVFSSSLLLDGNLDGPSDDVESRAICKLG